MKNIKLAVKCCGLILLLSMFTNTPLVHAEEDLGLCPDGFDQGIVTTGFVECYRESGRRSTREQAEAERLEREAVCNANPNSEVTSSAILGTPSGGFFSAVTCTVSREVPEGTVLCPTTSEEIYRAFDVLICRDFGNAAETAAEAQAALDTQIAECNAAEGGRVLQTNLSEEEFDDIVFFTSSVTCAFATAATDIIECPLGFEETDRDDNMIRCVLNERPFESLDEANAANTAAQSLCTDTTAGLGTVDEFTTTGETSNSEFFSLTICNIRIPRFGDYEDDSVIRACDASCTEEVIESRECLNGGVVGGPGCIDPATRQIVKRCNTGPDKDGLCPLVITPSAILKPLLLDDEEED